MGRVMVLDQCPSWEQASIGAETGNLGQRLVGARVLFVPLFAGTCKPPMYPVFLRETACRQSKQSNNNVGAKELVHHKSQCFGQFALFQETSRAERYSTHTLI